MSITGFKKQINKANQFMSERIGGAKGTELDDDFIEMEKKTDVLEKLVGDLMARTNELLQPNPASRAKMASVKAFSKIRGQTSQSLYPQVEGQLGECLIKYGRELGDSSLFGEALVATGESYKQLAEVKYSLEDKVKQDFIEPLHQLQDKDLKEINHHRKKLTSRRLDYDCKRRKQQKGASVTEDELRQAELKFEESKEVAEAAMHNLLDNDVEQISQLSAFIEAEISYHQSSLDILNSLLDNVRSKSNEAASRPRHEHVVKRATSIRSTGSTDRSPGSAPNYSYPSSYDTTPSDYKPAPGMTSSTSYSSASTRKDPFGSIDDDGPVYSQVIKKPAKTSANGGSRPTAKALFDFEPENDGELGFKEGAIINLTQRIDENWLEGEVGGSTGFFPVSYVEILVDLP